MAEQAEHKPLSAAAAAGGFSAEIDGVSPCDWDRLIAGFEDGNLFPTAGFAARRRPTRPITYFLVDTGLPEQALRASLSQTWRHQLKRGERSELDVQFRDAAEALPDFIALYHAMVARKQFIDREPLHVLP